MNPTGKALLTIIISFILGVVVGYFSFQLSHGTTERKEEQSGFYRLKNELHDRLSLTDAQQTTLDSLLQHRRVAFDTFRKQMSAQYHDMREETRDSIRQILTVEQKNGFEMFIKELDQQREREKGTTP